MKIDHCKFVIKLQTFKNFAVAPVVDCPTKLRTADHNKNNFQATEAK